MSTRRITLFVLGLLLSVTAWMVKDANLASAEGECPNVACTPCITPEGNPASLDCSIYLETSEDVFGDTKVRIWGYAPAGKMIMIGRGDTYPDAYKYTPLASYEVGWNGLFVTYDTNPPTDAAVVQYFLYVLEGNVPICNSSVTMNLMPAAEAPLPSESVVVDPPGSSYIYNNGDVFTNSIQANNSNFTGTLNFSGGTNNGQVFVNNGELDQSVTHVTNTVNVNINITNTYVTVLPEPAAKEPAKRDDSDQHSRGVNQPKPLTIEQIFVIVLWSLYEQLMSGWWIVGVVLTVLGAFVACWILFRRRLFW